MDWRELTRSPSSQRKFSSITKTQRSHKLAAKARKKTQNKDFSVLLTFSVVNARLTLTPDTPRGSVSESNQSYRAEEPDSE